MSPRFLTYEPQPVLIPLDAGVDRNFEGCDLGDRELGLCDRRTLFCDIFPSSDWRELLCVAPPFLNLGHPRGVFVQGASRKFRVEEPPNDPRVALVRIPLTGSEDLGSTFEVRFEFADFAVTARIRPRELGLLPVPLMLAAIQKDNDPQWVEDWSAWHRRAHLVDRIVVYDNGSANAEETYSRASRIGGLELVVVRWEFPYGPPGRFSANFAQTVALNHCRLTFGTKARWCINLDVDEYLYNESGLPLKEFLNRHHRRSVHYLNSLIVPMTVNNTSRRCFDSSIRLRQVSELARKYIYRPDCDDFVGIHRVGREHTRLKFGPVLERVRAVAYRLGLAGVVKLRRRLDALSRHFGKVIPVRKPESV